MFWRRKWWFLIPAAMVFTFAVSLLFVLPPTYRSEASILIEGQDVPEEIVPSLVTDYVDRRLDVLTRRVLSSDNLIRMIEQNDLYPEERELLSRSALAELMRDHIVINIISTQINDPRAGRESEMTTAFEIHFDYRNPEDARRVTDELVSLYLSTNLDTRRDVAQQTMEFLSSERAAVEQRIATIEDRLAEFQTENRELLPEEMAFKRQLLANLEQQLQSMERDLRALREREGFLTTEIALTDEFQPGDRRIGGATPESQLEQVRAELATARARYSANHPDVVRLARELASLEAVVGERAGASGLEARAENLVSELAGLRERYTASHPDVVRLENELASVRDAIAESGGTSGMADGRRRNSTYVQLSAQLNSVQTEIRSIEQQQRQLLEERRTLQEQLAQAPVVEREYVRLTRQLENAITDREALADKEATASLSGSLELQAIGERFVLAEPANLPLAPVSPQKRLILLLGFVLAVGSGGGTVVLSEMLDRSVRSTAQLTRILGDVPLALIPTIVSPAERHRALALRTAAVIGVIALSAGGAFWVHQAVVPLDVLGFEAWGTVDQWLATTFPEGTTSPTPE
jgi:uncharacterized protein involved in exopolysaccharide biosynthesis